jgi:uncharacterized protein YegP (UPF0339 family)
MNPENDRVEVFEDEDGEFRWRRVDKDNGQPVSGGGEGYRAKADALEAAATLNPEVELVDLTVEPEPKKKKRRG